MRRLVLATLAAVLLSVPLASADPPDRANSPQLDGTWFTSLTYYYEGTVEGSSDNLQYLTQFAKDGRAVIYLPQAAGQRFDESRTACAGDWSRRAGRTFDVTLYCVWRETWVGTPDRPDRILIKVTVAPDGKAFTATPFYYEYFDGTAYTHGIGYGAMNGIRLGIVPIP